MTRRNAIAHLSSLPATFKSGVSVKKIMTRFYLAAALLVLLLIGRPLNAACDQANGNGASSTAAKTGKWQVTTPDKIDWQPTNLLPPGAQIAVLEGDPSKPGFFTIRLKMPDGYRIPAHWHSQTERITVLSGTLHLGMGDGSNPGTALPFGAGIYCSMPPKMVHFGWTKGETILQLTSIGPWTVTYVKSADDPRNAGK